RRAAQEHAPSFRRGDRRRHGRQPLPLRHLHPHPGRHQGRRQRRCRMKPKPSPAVAAVYDRRTFIRVSTLAGGGFALSLALPGTAWAQAANAVDDTTRQFTPNAFIKITPENIITILAK